jgi:hypothetical protein
VIIVGVEPKVSGRRLWIDWTLDESLQAPWDEAGSVSDVAYTHTVSNGLQRSLTVD